MHVVSLYAGLLALLFVALSIRTLLMRRTFGISIGDAGNEASSYVQVPSETCRRLLSGEPGFRDFVFGALSGRIFELMQTLEEARSSQVEQRLARHITRHVASDGVLRATQVGIASDLGTAREVVSRALRALAARGLVRTGRMRVEVVNHAALRAFAELSG